METVELKIKRVVYGKDSTPEADREYKLADQPSPVGNIMEWSEFAASRGFKTLRVIEKDGSVKKQVV